jgi:GMP synthase (glutamine-hydrolysing)
MTLRVLVVDAYPKQGRKNLTSAGGTEGGLLYQRILERIAPDIETEVVHPADDEVPEAASLSSWDGAAWTGSNLSILDADDPAVSRQVELAARLIDARIPSFGSCFAIQLATVALGGTCRSSPNGREFGIARDIQLTAEGRTHPLYRDKPPVFDAFTSHADEVAALPSHTHLLAINDWSPVQAASLEEGAVPFWAVQYHPEYDLHEVASLCRLRKSELVAQGSFTSAGEAEAWSDDLEALHADPSRDDLAASLKVGESLLDESLRTVEVRNWIESQVRKTKR